MFSLLFVLTVTFLCVLISYLMSEDVTWFDYYKGGVIGLLISGVILQIWNKRRMKQEMKNKKSLYEQ
jgi:hypothetical protein